MTIDRAALVGDAERLGLCDPVRRSGMASFVAR